MLFRMAGRQERDLVIWLGLVGGSAVLYAFYGLRGTAPVLAVALVYLAVMLGGGVLAELGARTRLSLRWKIWGTIFLMLVILLGVSLITLEATNSTHDEIHAIQENTQHRLLTWIPAITFGGGLAAVALGVALSSSLIRPVGKMSEATRRIAAGDFSQPVQVSNRDELGELAASLNKGAKDLSRLQEALLAEERARSLQERVAQVTLAHEQDGGASHGSSTMAWDPPWQAWAIVSACTGKWSGPILQEVESGLDEVGALLRGYIDDIRELINELRPLASWAWLEPSANISSALLKSPGIDTSLTVSASLPTDPLTELTIYRVVQKSLTNVRRHAQATAVKVALRGSDDDVEVRVSDDGQGFDPEKAVTSTVKGIGLDSMRERAELVGGSFTGRSNPGQGCQTVLRIPARG